MNYTPKEIISFVEENDVKFIRLTFTDISGNLKNIAIMPGELERAFEYGIPFEAGFFSKGCSDLLLFPDISTMSVLPWRPKSGRVIRFFCHIMHTDGKKFIGDLRSELCDYICTMRESGFTSKISTKCEFYLFNTDENGSPVKIPHDNAGYLDIAPLDRCENARREICLSLEEMGFNPQTSRHSYGPGQNEIDFGRSNPVNAADNMVYYKTVVKNVAAQNGLFASFMPKPLAHSPGSGLHIAVTVKKNGQHIFSSQPQTLSDDGKYFIAGILSRIKEITCFLNPLTNSYERLTQSYTSSAQKNAVGAGPILIRLPYSYDGTPSVEIRTADAACNPYIVFRLILAAGFEGIENKLELKENVFSESSILRDDRLPATFSEAIKEAECSNFVRKCISDEVHSNYMEYYEKLLSEYSKYENKTEFEDKYYFNYI